MTSFWVLATGVIGQLLCGARIVVQWVRSERSGRSVSPALFWQLSLLGSAALVAYGVMRRDLAIVLGQLLVYFIYVRNLQLMGRWARDPAAVRWATCLVPLASVAYLAADAPRNLLPLLANHDVPGWLLAWGLLGQLVFTARFVVQWIHSEAIRQSVLTEAFWTLSVVGAAMMAVYAVFRRDPVLLVANVAGCVAYARNFVLAARS